MIYLKTYESFNSDNDLIVYHGGYIEGVIESPIYLTENEYMAKSYSNNVYKFKLNHKANILDLTNSDTFKEIKSEVYNNHSALYRKYYNKGYWATDKRVEGNYNILKKYKDYKDIEDSYIEKMKSDIWYKIDGLSERGFKGYYDDTSYIYDYICDGKASEDEIKFLDDFLLLHNVVTNMNRLNDVSLNEFGYFFKDYAEDNGYDGYKAISSDASGRSRMEEYLIINVSLLKLIEEDIFKVNESNDNIDVSELIYGLIHKYNDEYGIPPCDINKGECYNFAENLSSKLEGSELLSNDLFYNVADEYTKYNEDTFYKESDYNSRPPFGFKWYKNGYHGWVYYNGRHYDSETPDGVVNFYDLPIFKNYRRDVIKNLKTYESFLQKIEIDEHGKNIVWRNNNIFITVNDIDNATYIGLWDSDAKGRKKVGFIILSSERFYKSKIYRKIDSVEIESKYRGSGYGLLLYKTALRYLRKDIDGLYSYLPDRVNKVQVPNIYKRLNSWNDEGDFEYIERGIVMNETFSDISNLTLPGGYNHGGCNLFAVGLHRVTGYALYTVRGYYKEQDWEEVIEMGHEPGYYHEDAHVVVKLPNGNYLDADGEMSEKELLDLSHFGSHIENVKIEPVSELEAINIFYGEDEQENIKPEDEQEIHDIINIITKNNKIVESISVKPYVKRVDKEYNDIIIDMINDDFNANGTGFIGLFINDNIIGAVMIDEDYLPFEYRFDIVIDKEYRGSGYSKLLIDKLIKEFKSDSEVDQLSAIVMNKKLLKILVDYYDFGHDKFDGDDFVWIRKGDLNNIKTFESFSNSNMLKVLYHGSTNKFKSFNRKELGSNMGKTPSNLKGFFFSDNKQVAQSFGKYLYTVRVYMEKPYIVDAKGQDYSEFKHELNDIVDNLSSEYDSIIIKNYRDSFENEPSVSTQYIIFETKNIKIISD